MPRKPNYRFERFERERTRAAKKAARAQAKAEKKAKTEGLIAEDHGAEDSGQATDDQPSPD